MNGAPPLTVETATAIIGDEREDAIAVLTMSPIAYWPELRDDDYRLMGLMGGAASIGLGLAIGKPDRPVWVIDGDGSLLMQLGVLPAIGDARPTKLTHIVIDNGIYAVSGGQSTPGRPTNWSALFEAAGYSEGHSCSSEAELRALLRDISSPGPRGIAVRCKAIRPDYPAGAFAGIDPADEAARVRGALAV